MIYYTLLAKYALDIAYDRDTDQHLSTFDDQKTCHEKNKGLDAEYSIKLWLISR